MSWQYSPRLIALTLVSLAAVTWNSQAIAQPAAPPESEPLALVGTYPLPGDIFRDRIVFYFNLPLAPVDDPSTLIHISPPLAGAWSQGDHHVTLALPANKKREPGLYQATFLPALQSTQGGVPVPPPSPLLFTDFALEFTGVSWGNIGVQQANVQLNFSAPVPWEQVQQHLTVTDASGAPVQYTSPRRSATTQHLVVIPTTATAPFSMVLSPGLTDQSGRFQTKEEARKILNGPGNFTLSELDWSHWNLDTDRLSLKVSYPVDYARLLEHFQVFADEETTPLPLDHHDNEDKTAFRFKFPRPAKPYKVLRYVFTPGLAQVPVLYPQSAQQGTLTLKRDPLRIEYHNWESEGVAPLRLQLFFNGQVSAEDLKPHLAVSPSVPDLELQPGKYGGIDLLADWKPEQKYGLTISAGLTDQDDRLSVVEPITWYAGNPPERSGVGFAYEAPYYFPRRAAGPLKLYGRNLKEARVTLHELFPSNLVQALNEMQEGKSPASFGYSLGRQLAETTVKFPGEPGEKEEVAVPIADFMPPDLKGIFGLTLSPGYDYYSTKIVVWTDIGVLAHWQDDQLLVYTHNLWNLEPLQGAKVSVYSSKHQRMGEITSGPDGVATLSNWDTELGHPRVLIVETADDFTFLPLNERGEDPVGFNYSMPEYDAKGYDAFLYADRNLYRPGETMHLRWLVRNADGSPLTGAPLQLRIVDPKESSKNSTSELSAWGSGSADIETARNWLTGAYRVELWVPGADTALTTQTVNVEDFIPNRITVSVTPGVPYWLPGETHPLTVNGEQLSGGPARERKTGAAVMLGKAPWKPAQWPDYTFTNDAPFTSDVQDLGESQTDGTGNAAYAFTWQPPKNTSFPVQATVRGEVFELGGRSVAARATAFLFPTPVITGLAVANGSAPNSVDVAVVAVQPDGAPAGISQVQVTLERQQWSYYVRRYSSHNEANWSDNFATLRTETVTLDGGKGAINLPVPEGYGTYRIRVQQPDSPQYATQTFWSYRGQAQLVDASRPSLIKLEADKPSYNLSETATVRIESPFDGNAIVVVQGAKIEQSITVPITDGAGTLTLPLAASHYPNVWLEATVIHPVEPGAPLTYPYASFAMLNIPVHDPARTLAVSFPDLPSEIRPMTQLDVTLNVNGPEGAPVASEVTLALVDEGIHQILQYQNPDPVAWFQRNRRPLYRRAHYYDQVAYDFEAAKIGGGELLKKRLGDDDATVGENWIKPLALWSGVAETDATGTAVVSMAIPEFAGKVRLVAVATTGSEAGSQAANVTIRRPVILQTTLPRFVAPNDSFEATVLIQNKRDTAMKTVLRAEAFDSLAMDAFEQTWDLDPNGEAMVRIPLRAGELPGSGVIRWTMTTTTPEGAPVDDYTAETPLKIQAPSIYQVRSETLIIPAGEQRDLTNTEFLENSVLTAKLYVTPNPLVRVRDALEYVIGYPHGCLEQTTSRCMPLFLLGQAAAKTGDTWEAAHFKQYIQAGIDRLFSMQTKSGGIGYWPGARDPYPYGSIYAAHFLSLAKNDPAFTVPQDEYDRLMKYIKERIPLDPTEGYMSLYQYSYACYVRALSKDTSVMEDINSLDAIPVSTAARQWLAMAALSFTGAEDQAQQYLLTHPSTPYDAHEQGGALNSVIRNDAITLMMQMAIGADNSLVQPQAEKLMRYLEKRRYSTQDAAFLVTALAEYLKKNAGDLNQANMNITTPEGTEDHTGDFAFRTTHKGPGTAYHVVNRGATPLYVYFTTEGILKNPEVTAEANGIRVARTLHNDTGIIPQDTLKHGENYLISLEITCDEDFENIVLVDLLPGGLEVENPRLDGGAMAAWKKKGGLIPSYLDLRDDRLVAAFDRLSRGTHHFYYVARAVTPGTFQHPGANAECMYDVQFNGRTAGGSITITP